MTVKIWIGNLGKYNEAISHGDWLTLPIADEEDFAEFLEQKCGIGECDEFGQPYEEWHICDVYSDIPGITIGEYASVREIMELSELVEEIESLKDYEYKACLAFMEADTDDWKFAIECIESGRYLHLSHIDNYYDLGEYWFIESGYRNEMPEHLIEFFNFEKYGEHCGEQGCMTSYGYFESY